MILSEWFGVSLTLHCDDNSFILCLKGSEKKITLGSVNPQFYTSDAEISCSKWRPKREGWDSPQDEIFLPGLSAIKSNVIEETACGFHVNYDLVGCMSWMLSRIEEINDQHRDRFDRFPMKRSAAFKNGFSRRPIVDELLIVLGQIIERCWPEVTVRRKIYSVQVSHDVDRMNTIGPSDFQLTSLVNGGRAILLDLLKRGDYSVLGNPVRSLRFDKLKEDNFNSFNWIMETSDRHRLTSAFHFICGRTSISKDASYDIRHYDTRRLLRRIHDQGHEICLHPSFNTYNNPDALKHEADLLRQVLFDEGIQQDTLGARMHYLRWSHPSTLHALDNAGLSYDCTLGYAEYPGFRCGTCQEYPAYDPVNDRVLNLRIRPLIAMESSLLKKRVLNCEEEANAYSEFDQVRQACHAVGGQFTLLWHNCEFFSAQRREMYVSLISN